MDDIGRLFFFLFLYIVWQVFKAIKKSASGTGGAANPTVKLLELLRKVFAEGVDLEKALDQVSRQESPAKQQVPRVRRAKVLPRRAAPVVEMQPLEERVASKITMPSHRRPRQPVLSAARRRRLQQAVVWSEILGKPVGLRD